MLLRGPHASIELHTEGYQFPSGQRHVEDPNWLVIAGTVVTSDERWTFRDPALTTFEVEGLATWFGDVAADRHPRWQELGFLEPLLTFRQLRPDSFDLRLALSHEAAPVVAFDEEVLLELTPTQRDLEAAVSDLRSDLARFPARGTDEAAIDSVDAIRGLDEWRSFMVEAMQWLAAAPDAQLGALPETSFLVDEMVITFSVHAEQTRRLAAASKRPMFEGGATPAVEHLHELVTKLPSEGSSGLWTPRSLSQAEEWEEVRVAARSALVALGQPRRDAELRLLPAVAKSHW